MSKKHTKQEHEKLLTLGRAVIATETEALEKLNERIDENFVQACLYMLDCKGRVVVLGMGKSGHIGNKIAATLASTGTPAFFIHPGEASHGDLGMIKDDDVVIALSNSGETDEIITLLPVIKRLGVPLVSLTGNKNSSLAKTASVNIDVSVEQEACPLGLAPTASTTAALAMGDALAIALLEARGFGAEDFAIAHPGGMLGRRLLLHVSDIMHTGKELPTVLETTLLSEALLIMTQMGLGSTAIVDKENFVLGIFTDGDLRRALDNDIDIHKASIDEVMTRDCKTISKDCLAAEALAIMEDSRINALPVIDKENKLIGLLNMHDLLRARVV
jgi:arabinose-5-phosphate isomerase